MILEKEAQAVVALLALPPLESLVGQ